jgi:hypothetical protein
LRHWNFESRLSWLTTKICVRLRNLWILKESNPQISPMDADFLIAGLVARRVSEAPQSPRGRVGFPKRQPRGARGDDFPKFVFPGFLRSGFESAKSG